MATRFAQLRTEAGFSQTALAKKMGVSRSTVAMWETGGATPTADMLFSLADLYGVSLDYLLGRSEKSKTDWPYNIHPELASLLIKFENSDHAHQQFALKSLKGILDENQ